MEFFVGQINLFGKSLLHNPMRTDFELIELIEKNIN